MRAAPGKSNRSAMLVKVAGIAVATSMILGALGLLASYLEPSAPYKHWAYHQFQQDYEKITWIYETAIARPRPVENLFMGASHTFNGIDDNRIAGYFRNPSAAYNAGISGGGRNIEYAILKDIFARHPPKRLFVDVRETEERTGHFGFAVLADGTDVATAPANPWWFGDFVTLLRYRFLFMRLAIWDRAALTPKAGTVPQFGFEPNPLVTAPTDLHKQSLDLTANKKWRLLPAAFGDLEFRANEQYLVKIAKLCADNRVELHFLYLPYFDGPSEPRQAAFYRRLGLLHEMPEEIRHNPSYWANLTHLNRKGAEVYTDWLIHTLLMRPPRLHTISHSSR